MEPSHRPTSIFTTTEGHSITYKTFINKIEERQLTEIYLQANDAAKAGTPTGRAKFQADDKAFELVIVNLDGTTENILGRILELPTSEYNEMSEIVAKVIEPKKK